METSEPTDKEALCDVYKELYELIGYENTLIVYEHFRGYQINFPTRLYSRKYVREVVRKEYDGSNIKELARKLGYSERWIRQIVEDSKKASIYEK